MGPTLKIDILPFLGVQAAAFYNQSNCKIVDEKIKQKSILVPIDARLNLKFDSEKATGIYLSTGPQFGFNVGDADYNIFGSNSSEAKDKIYAAFDGEVVYSKTMSGYGNLIRIKHANGLETYYAHNSKNLVKVGQHVKA